MSLGELVPVFCYQAAFCLTMLFLPVMAWRAEVETFLFGAVVMYMCLRVIRKRLQKLLPAEGKAVFVTGCDTGFGHLAAIRLHEKGYTVFAGCLEPQGQGANDLTEKCPDRLYVVPLDVTDDKSVNAARELVENKLGDNCLWGLVNNAGIFGLGDVELCTMENFRSLMEVNYFGMLRITKRFLPLIRRSRGRVVVMSSTSARYPWPTSAAYHSAKAALEGATSCLRLEMTRFRVKVISVQPAMFGGSTEIHGQKNVVRYKTEMKRSWETASPEVKAAYHPKYLENQIEAITSNRKSLDAKSPDPVIDAIEAGISAEKPNNTYVVHGGPFYVDPIAIYSVLYGYLPDFITDWLACKVMGICPPPEDTPTGARPERNGPLKSE